MNDNAPSNIAREESFELENPEVSVGTVFSDVKVMESTDGKCHVEIYGKSEGAKNLAELVEINSEGQKISINVDKRNKGLRGFFRGGSTDLLVTIKLPKTSTLKVRTVSADVEVNQSLRSIEVGSVSGDITVFKNPSGACTLKTVSGDITAHTISACQYSLKSVSGDISVQIAPGLEVDVDGKSISGDLESEISLNSHEDVHAGNSELVTISTSTISGDFKLSRS